MAELANASIIRLRDPGSNLGIDRIFSYSDDVLGSKGTHMTYPIFAPLVYLNMPLQVTLVIHSSRDEVPSRFGSQPIPALVSLEIISVARAKYSPCHVL
jgi:hypothetical protein